MSEPTIVEANVRDGDDDDWHIECRFSDGQKFAAVKVDKEFLGLAGTIAWLLTKHAEAEAEIR